MTESRPIRSLTFTIGRDKFFGIRNAFWLNEILNTAIVVFGSVLVSPSRTTVVQ